ncbi:hypothetical protein FB451DRAFT_1189536 [Mycena latifolia]|nr:hypothetical protein FB451DRAFT_1189536 [Mycena latifolia]
MARPGLRMFTRSWGHAPRKTVTGRRTALVNNPREGGAINDGFPGWLLCSVDGWRGRLGVWLRLRGKADGGGVEVIQAGDEGLEYCGSCLLLDGRESIGCAKCVEGWLRVGNGCPVYRGRELSGGGPVYGRGGAARPLRKWELLAAGDPPDYDMEWGDHGFQSTAAASQGFDESNYYTHDMPPKTQHSPEGSRGWALVSRRSGFGGDYTGLVKKGLLLVATPLYGERGTGPAWSDRAVCIIPIISPAVAAQDLNGRSRREMLDLWGGTAVQMWHDKTAVVSANTYLTGRPAFELSDSYLLAPSKVNECSGNPDSSRARPWGPVNELGGWHATRTFAQCVNSSSVVIDRV